MTLPLSHSSNGKRCPCPSPGVTPAGVPGEAARPVLQQYPATGHKPLHFFTIRRLALVAAEAIST
jgi:hypothetical protein